MVSKLRLHRTNKARKRILTRGTAFHASVGRKPKGHIMVSSAKFPWGTMILVASRDQSPVYLTYKIG